MTDMNETAGNGQLRAFRAGCLEVRNGPLAQLCTRALDGDDAARQRVTVIMAGGPDPGTCAEWDCRNAAEPGASCCPPCQARQDLVPLYGRPHRPKLTGEPGARSCRICGREADRFWDIHQPEGAARG